MDKKYIDSKQLSHEELAQYSGVDGDFKEWFLRSGFRFFKRELAWEDDLIPALQSADKEDELTAKVLALLKILNIPVFWYEELSDIITDEFTGREKKRRIGFIQPCVRALAYYEWKDRALEFYNYLVEDSDFPASEFELMLSDYYNETEFHSDAPLFCGPIKTMEAHITEGLLRNIDKQHPDSSALSVKYWFDYALWSDTELHEKRVRNNEFCGQLAMDCYCVLMQKGYKERAEDFICWLSYTQNIRCLQKDQQEEIFKLRADVPVLDPVEANGMSCEEALSVKCEALLHDVWEDKRGNSRIPSEEDQEAVFNALKLSMECYFAGTLRLLREKKHDLIRDLLVAAHWAPPGYYCIRTPPYVNELSLELLSLMRSRIKYEVNKFNPYDYWMAFDVVERMPQQAKALRQLLVTMRACKYPCSDEALEFKPQLKKTKSNYFYVFEPYKGCSPCECVARFIHSVACSSYSDENKVWCLELAEYCLSRVKAKKDNKGKFNRSDGYYKHSLCVEEDPVWRRAYVMALGELGYDLSGNVHGALKFVCEYDPDEIVRAEAKHALKSIKRETKKHLENKKSFMAAFFWLRWAQRESLGCKVNEGLAMMTRRGELRGDFKHKADRLYKPSIY